MPQPTPRFFAALLTIAVLWVFSPAPEKASQSTPGLSTHAAPPGLPAIIQAQTGRESGYDTAYTAHFNNRGSAAGIQNTRLSNLIFEDNLNTKYSRLPPGLLNFVAEVADGEKDRVLGVFVQDVLALPVLQQPANDPAFVSEEYGVATQFQSADHFGVIGLLAHNYLSGQLFYDLEIGQTVYIIMGDGELQRYVVDEIARYEKLDPTSLRSALVDQVDGKTYSTPQVFRRFYRQPHKVTFQTCLEGEGRLNWGLIFIAAIPVEG